MDATDRNAPATAGTTGNGSSSRAPGLLAGATGDGATGDSASSQVPGLADQIAVRRAGSGEWAALRRIRLAALADSPGAFGSTLAYEREFGEEEWLRRTQTAIWYLAWQGSDPVGMAAAFRVTGEPGTAASGSQGAGPGSEWHLVSMWASPRVRGQGVAGRLVDALTAAVREAGAIRLTLWAADGNDRARGFYRRYGFRPTGRRQAYQRPDGSTFDEHEFSLDL